MILFLTDAVVPTSGTFEVKMVKTPSLNLGITINGTPNRSSRLYMYMYMYMYAMVTYSSSSIVLNIHVHVHVHVRNGYVL